MTKQEEHSPKTPWVRTLAPELRGYTAHLITAGSTLALDAWLTALRPWPLKVVIDRVISGKECRVPFFSGWINDTGNEAMLILAAACAASLVIAVGTGICTYIYTLLMGTVSQGLMFSLRRRLFTHLQKLSLRFHSTRRIGDLMTRLISDISAIRMLVARGLMQFLSNALLILATLAMMLWLNWRFALVASSVAPLLFWAVWWHTRRIKAESRWARKSDGALAAVAQESLTMIETVKGLAQESAQEDRFVHQGRRSLRHYISRLNYQARMMPIVDLLAAFGMVLVMWFGTTGVLRGQMTTGDVVVFFAYVTNFYSPMRAISRQAAIFTKAAAGAERVAEVLLTEPDVSDGPAAMPAPRFKGEVAFKEICFSHTDGQPVLTNFSMHIKPGEHVAIMGATGAGKSTIAGLLLKFYKPDSGCIQVDGKDIRDFTAGSLRRQIGLVLQESMLFHGTVRDNILIGHPGASARELVNASRVANVEEFVKRLPRGFDTPVAEGGKNFSGGQRQRIAIARATIRQAPILLFDEPTSSLDMEMEAEVIRSIELASVGRTMILVTHRPETLRLVERVVVLHDGYIAEECSPETVLSRYAGTLFSHGPSPHFPN